MATALITGFGPNGTAVPAFWVTARMRLTMLRHGLRDANTAAWSYLGAAFGLLLAAATIWVAVAYPQLLASALGLWLLGWMIAPVITHGGDSLRPEYFVAIGLTPGRLGMALLGGSLVGFGPLISLVATASLVVYGFDHGVAAGMLAIPAMLVTLLLYVSMSKLSTALYVLLVRIPLGAAVAGVVTGFVVAFAAQGWALVVALVSHDLAAPLDEGARFLPSGWGVVAIDAAAGSDPLRVTGALLGTLALIMLAVLAWGWLLGRRSVSTAIRVRPWRLLQGRDARSAARAKELRSFLRDPLQINRLLFALSYGLAFVLMPVALGWTGMVPWAAPIFIVMAVSVSANLYGSDGTALWLVITTPGAAGRDVRARQQTFLMMVAPTAILTTAIAVWLVDAPEQWPYVIAASTALLGAGAGLIVLLSVYAPTPMTDPHKRSSNPLDTGVTADASGGMYVAMFAVILAAVPAVLTVWLLGWWGVLIGSLTGLICWHQFGRLAARRLKSSGPELLAVLRHGRPRMSAGAASETSSVLGTMPKQQRRLVVICFLLGAIPLFPQGVVPLIFLIVQNPARVWFLAMYLPAPVNWIVATAMIMLGLTMYVYGSVAYTRAARRARSGPDSVALLNSRPTSPSVSGRARSRDS